MANQIGPNITVPLISPQVGFTDSLFPLKGARERGSGNEVDASWPRFAFSRAVNVLKIDNIANRGATLL